MTEKKEIQQKMLETVILTEEKERKRLAGDLHDGLGPVLSAVNLYFQAYLDAPEIQKPEIEIRLKQKIENAIADVSRISHNISPHILEKFGLITALDNFINQIRLTEKIKFSTNFQKINRFDLKAELTIYRTITELINNTLKHAFASDNGKGFDIKQIDENQKGIGLNNMKNRVNSLNGKISINSSKNTGITVEISLPYVEN
jgi:signal transduction histidine kinase